jgi:Uma2 family endonuclease
MMAPAIKLEERYSYQDYLTWSDDERWEIINGIPYNMSPAPTRWHQKISGELFKTIAVLLENRPCEVFAAPFDVVLLEQSEENDTVVQPDIVVVCDESKLNDRGCNGAPDFIIEILSESTASRDLHEKLMIYEHFGVKEYWIVDLWSRTIRIHLYENGEFSIVKLFTEKDSLPATVLQGLNIDLKELFKHIPKQTLT